MGYYTGRISVMREWLSRLVTYGRALMEGPVKPHSHRVPDLHKSCMDSSTAEEARERPGRLLNC